MKEGSTEYAIFHQFYPGMYAKKPLEIEEKLGNQNLNLPISFFYGDRDWMDESAGRRVLLKNIYGGQSQDLESERLSQHYIVPRSDHHMYFDNPTDFVDLMIKDIELAERNHPRLFRNVI